MSLTLGARIGPYEVVAPVGTGGMGEVWRARDTKLGRDVALKILPELFATDPERLARFQREARVLASLSHPNIAIIHGLEELDGVPALVLELVEGPTLADRLAEGPIPLDDVLAIAHQIAEALEAAHEQGIVHRDLKPSNIKVRADGAVKVLDFGLAKVLDPGLNALDVMQSPTTTSPAATPTGVILGTAAYMSPEQARGGGVDTRADVWAFGCVLYETLTGRQAFQAATVPETLAAVLTREADFRALPSNLTPRLVDLLRRCLEKNPKRRWQAVGDLRAELEIIAAAPRMVPVDTQVVAQRRPGRRRAIPVLIAATLAGAVVGISVWILARNLSTPPFITRFSLALVERPESLPDITISPDGTKIVYVANQRLYVRLLSEFETTPIPGTDTSELLGNPVFSPDSRSLAFWSGTPKSGRLKKIAVTGGVAITICQAGIPSGISWGSDGIVFGQAGKGILRVSANGGTPESLVTVKDDEVPFGPQVLPGSQSVLFTLARTGGAPEPNVINLREGSPIDIWNRARIVAQSLKSGERKTLVEGGFDARYLLTGHLVYALGDALLAVPFDLKRQEVSGGPVPVVEGTRRTFRSAAHLCASVPLGWRRTGPDPVSARPRLHPDDGTLSRM